MPWIATDKNGGVVERNHRVKLGCDDPNALLFYTTDGSEPALHTSTTIVCVLCDLIIVTFVRSVIK